MADTQMQIQSTHTRPDGKPVIRGLLLDIPGAELIEYAHGRSKHHADRAKIYTDKAAEIIKLQKESDETTRMIAKGGNANAADAMESSAKNHERKARFFKYAAEHFIADVVYRLDSQELVALEIMPDRY